MDFCAHDNFFELLDDMGFFTYFSCFIEIFSTTRSYTMWTKYLAWFPQGFKCPHSSYEKSFKIDIDLDLCIDLDLILSGLPITI